MGTLEYATQRLRGVLTEIQNLQDEDFPYRHSRMALEHIANQVKERLDILSELDETDGEIVIKTACSESLLQHFRHLPLLGFIVRSTHIRNSFEVF